LTDGRRVIVETRGLEDVDVAPKLARLRQWCGDVNQIPGGRKFSFVFVVNGRVERQPNIIRQSRQPAAV